MVTHAPWEFATTTMSKCAKPKPTKTVSDLSYIRARIQARFETNLISYIIPDDILTKYPVRVAEIAPVLFTVVILRSLEPYGKPASTTKEGLELYDALYTSFDPLSVGKQSAFHQIFQVMWFKLSITDTATCKEHRTLLSKNAKTFVHDNIPGTKDWLRMLCEYVISGKAPNAILDTEQPTDLYTVDISLNNASQETLPTLETLLNGEIDWTTGVDIDNVLMSTNLE